MERKKREGKKKKKKKKDEDSDFLTSKLCGNEFQTALERSQGKAFRVFQRFSARIWTSTISFDVNCYEAFCDRKPRFALTSAFDLSR